MNKESTYDSFRCHFVFLILARTHTHTHVRKTFAAVLLYWMKLFLYFRFWLSLWRQITLSIYRLELCNRMCAMNFDRILFYLFIFSRYNKRIVCQFCFALHRWATNAEQKVREWESESKEKKFKCRSTTSRNSKSRYIYRRHQINRMNFAQASTTTAAAKYNSTDAPNFKRKMRARNRNVNT